MTGGRRLQPLRGTHEAAYIFCIVEIELFDASGARIEAKSSIASSASPGKGASHLVDGKLALDGAYGGVYGGGVLCILLGIGVVRPLARTSPRRATNEAVNAAKS